jgi:hypothetical protein
VAVLRGEESTDGTGDTRVGKNAPSKHGSDDVRAAVEQRRCREIDEEKFALLNSVEGAGTTGLGEIG